MAKEFLEFIGCCLFAVPGQSGHIVPDGVELYFFDRGSFANPGHEEFHWPVVLCPARSGHRVCEHIGAPAITLLPKALKHGFKRGIHGQRSILPCAAFSLSGPKAQFFPLDAQIIP